MDSKRNAFSLAILALLISSLALYFGTGLHPLWWLTWLAPIPVLLVAPRLRPLSAFLVAFVASAAGATNMWIYHRVLLSIPLGVVLSIIFLPALVFAVDVMVYRWVLPTSACRAALIFPSIWVFCEFVSESLSPHSTFGNISYSQMNFLPVLQLASVTGIWGISFCLFLFAATVSALLSGYGTVRERRSLAVSVGIVFVIVLSFGAWRLGSTPPAQLSVTVGLVASDLRQNIVTDQPADTMRLLHQYMDEAQKLADQGAKIIVIPEKISVFLNPDLPQFDALLQSTATQTGADIVVGVIHPDQPDKWNEARLYTPAGSILTYEKHHMLPSYESSFTVGTKRTEWQEPSGRLGITICKDMDFPHLSRQYGNDGVGLLLVPAWDFNVDGWLHGRMAILRGVESGFSIARSPKMGVLSVTDDRGRVLAERETNSAPFATLVATVPVRHDATIYARLGNWFAWLNVVGLLVLIGTAIWAARRNRA